MFLLTFSKKTYKSLPVEITTHKNKIKVRRLHFSYHKNHLSAMFSHLKYHKNRINDKDLVPRCLSVFLGFEFCKQYLLSEYCFLVLKRNRSLSVSYGPYGTSSNKTKVLFWFLYSTICTQQLRLDTKVTRGKPNEDLSSPEMTKLIFADPDQSLQSVTILNWAG